MDRLRALILAILFVLSGWRASAEGIDLFRKAEAAFRFQDYKTASTLLEKLLYPKPKIRDRARLIKAHEYLGACYFWLKRPKRMEEEFTALLVLDPTHKLDPFYYPVPLIEQFEVLRKRLITLGVIKIQKKRPKPRPKKCRTRVITEVQRSKVACFIPFGVGQFANGEPKKGIAFATSQGIGLGINIGAFVGIWALRGSDGRYSSRDAHTARILRYVQYAGLGIFAASMVWGIVDALKNFKGKTTTNKVIVTPCGITGKF